MIDNRILPVPVGDRAAARGRSGHTEPSADQLPRQATGERVDHRPGEEFFVLFARYTDRGLHQPELSTVRGRLLIHSGDCTGAGFPVHSPNGTAATTRALGYRAEWHATGYVVYNIVGHDVNQITDVTVRHTYK
ncbi:hypothetical protein [Rhodococcus sp. NCIMB 12038]|uniref:hypothetical protein n=1 Tax=Rhodococcus sp. NCIMB 12038 TaxID=933800 RepID=UPI0015C630DA|nr:hypothetical protein [Rhodococcus sp. NCIMB 12038]